MDEYEKGKAHAKAAEDLIIERIREGCGCLVIILLFLSFLLVR